jgi:transaldolase
VTATERLHERGQSIWLDNITREMLDSGELQAYIDDYSVTGLTSNPSIFDKAIAAGGYDDAIRAKATRGTQPEALFFELAIEDPDAVAARLQSDGATSLVDRNDLIAHIEEQSGALRA